MDDALAAVLGALDGTELAYVVIGGHAVNTWLEPRFTADVDVTIQAGPKEIQHLKDVLGARGYRATSEHGADRPSGPDFVRFVCDRDAITLEVQAAKTEFQRESIRRATASGSSPRIATPEDLIVMKLIANRPKDQVDLQGLAQLDGLDWAYVERWAAEWDVTDRLRPLRAGGLGPKR